MVLGLSEEEKERVRYHLGYLETNFAASLQLGIPRPIQTIFLVETAMSQLQNAYAVRRCRKILDALDSIEEQLLDPGVPLLYASQLGELKLRESQRGSTSTDLIEREYVRWANRLADMLGVPLYPYSARFKKSGPGNVPVRTL